MYTIITWIVYGILIIFIALCTIYSIADTVRNIVPNTRVAITNYMDAVINKITVVCAYADQTCGVPFLGGALYIILPRLKIVLDTSDTSITNIYVLGIDMANNIEVYGLSAGMVSVWFVVRGFKIKQDNSDRKKVEDSLKQITERLSK